MNFFFANLIIKIENFFKKNHDILDKKLIVWLIEKDCSVCHEISINLFKKVISAQNNRKDVVCNLHSLKNCTINR